jgi:hypothetical protein
MPTRGLAGLFVSLLLATPVGAAPIQLVINNGLAPPDPANVIDADYDPFLFDVFVRNVGCGSSFPLDAPCDQPGAPTRVALVAGGVINEILAVFDTSVLEVTGGSTLLLRAFDGSTLLLRGGTVTNTLQTGGSAYVSITGGSVEQFSYPGESSLVDVEGGTLARILPTGESLTLLRGGSVTDYVAASGFATVKMSAGTVGTFLAAFTSGRVELCGGSVGGELSTNELGSVLWSGGAVGGLVVADGSSTITIEGTGFAIDGVPVPDGPLPDQTGTVCGTRVLSGTLASGEPFANPFAHDGCFDPPLGREITGTIVVPEAGGRVLGATALLTLVGLGAAGAGRAPVS